MSDLYRGPRTFWRVPYIEDLEGIERGDVVVLGAPVDDMVTHRPGTRFGPEAIRGGYEDGPPELWHMDLGIDPFETLNVLDLGDLNVKPGDWEFNRHAIYDAVAEIVAAGATPVVLGGDHSIAYPTITGVADAARGADLAVIQFDAHADTAAELYGSRWSHGCPFRHLVDEGVIPGPRLVQIGLRGGWPPKAEFEWMRSAGVLWYRMEEVRSDGMEAVIGAALDDVPESCQVYLSIDIDSLDPAFAPGTGTPEPGGLTSWELLTAVRRFALERDVIGLEVVEVSPPYDHADITATAANRVVIEALCGMAVHRSNRDPEPEDPA